MSGTDIVCDTTRYAGTAHRRPHGAILRYATSVPHSAQHATPCAVLTKRMAAHHQRYQDGPSGTNPPTALRSAMLCPVLTYSIVLSSYALAMRCAVLIQYRVYASAVRCL
eukprot:1619167-Rhodomonas_salina.2